MSEIFNLSWNDYQSNISKSFSMLRRNVDLADVTLVTDDLKLTKAHKIILSSCSEFFKKVFQNSDIQGNLFLHLTGVSSNELNQVLDYIYCGEAKILQEDLDKFLNTAQTLKLEGLLQKEEDTKTILNGTSMGEDVSLIDECQEEEQTLNETLKSFQKALKAENNIVSKISLGDDVNLVELDKKIHESMEIDFDCYKCKICGKVTTGRNRKQQMSSHIETHFEGLSLICKVCGKSNKTRNALYQHKSIYKH